MAKKPTRKAIHLATEEVHKQTLRGYARAWLPISQIVFDFLLVAFTLGLVWTSVKQWEVTRLGGSEVNKAFLYAGDFALVPMITEEEEVLNRRMQVTFHLTNSGNTPARHVHMVTNAMFQDIPKDFDFPDFGDNTDRTMGARFVAPKSQINKTIFLNAYEVMRANYEGKPLVIYGHIEYTDDIFKARHTTWFCVHYIAPRHHGMLGTFAECTHHNCSDDDCPRPPYWEPPVRPTKPESVTVQDMKTLLDAVRQNEPEINFAPAVNPDATPSMGSLPLK